MQAGRRCAAALAWPKSRTRCRFGSVQLNLVAPRMPTIPTPDQFDAVTRTDLPRIPRCRVSVWGVSATYNMARASLCRMLPRPDKTGHEGKSANSKRPRVRI
jgi:hypothetical protein